jgi:hypothetical protein
MVDDKTKSQIEAAADAVKTVVTLSSGVLTITLTFASTLAAGADPGWQAALRWSWLLLGVAVAAGIWFLLARTGIIYAGKATDVFDWRLRLPWLIQLAAFIAAVVIFALFGATQFEDIAAPPATTTP